MRKQQDKHDFFLLIFDQTSQNFFFKYFSNKNISLNWILVIFDHI